MSRVIVLFISLLCAMLPVKVSAQVSTDVEQGRRYGVLIEVDRAAISGVCIMREKDEQILGAIVNEFGVTAFGFSYKPKTGRVRVVNVIPQLDRWYIRHVLRRDIRAMMPCLMAQQPDKEYEYHNDKYKIRYRFTPISATN